MSKLILFLVFSGLSGGAYSLFIMYFVAYLDGNNPIYHAHYSLYYLVGNLTVSALLIPAGLLTDKIGRKRALIIGASIVAAGGFIAPMATQWWQLLFGSAILSAGSALITPAQASLIADITRGYRREKSYGVVAFTSVGSTTFGLLILMVYTAVFSSILPSDVYFRFMLTFVAILGLIAVIPILFIGRPVLAGKNLPLSPSQDIGRFPIGRREGLETQVPSSTAVGLETQESYETPSSLRGNRVVQKVIAINLLLGFGAGFIIPLFTYYWGDIFKLTELSIDGITALGYIGMAAGSLVTPWVARHATKYGGRVGTIVAFQSASIIFAGYLAIVPFQMNLPLAVVAYILRMDFMNVIGPLTSALLMDHSPANRRGLANSLVNIAFNVPNGISPSFTSMILVAVPAPFGYTYSISFMITLYIMGAIIYATTRKPDRLVRLAQHNIS